MWPVFYKILRKSNAVFKVDEPQLELTVSMADCKRELKKAGVEYNKICDEYITFPAKIFDGLDMMIGLHYAFGFVKHIEIFRPKEYYASPDADILESYSEIHDALVSCYGEPQASKPAYLSGYPSERWLGRNFVIDHYIIDRFGPEEHFTFLFVQP